MSETIPHILFAGGGTGGHVYPAIAIADAVKELQPQAEVAFAGTQDRMEWEAVPQAGYPIHPITAAGLQRKLSARNLSLPFKLSKGLFESFRLVRRFEPHVAVGTGGYVSGPVLAAAAVQGVPCVLQEQNAYAGMANRMLAKMAKEIHIAFEEARDYLPAEKCIMSGNPTRKHLREANPTEAKQHFGLDEAKVTLLILGGSLGSEAINQSVKNHHRALLEQVDGLHIVWQCGERYYDKLKREVADHQRLKLMKYIERMDLAYAAADLALCRSGAITCSELMVTKTPAVLVPSPNVTADHQTKNALGMVRHGAAELLRETDLQGQFAMTLRTLLEDGARRRQMAETAGRIARPQAAEDIAKHVLALAKS